MGAAITKAFAAEGAKLALVGRDIAAIEPVADEVRAARRAGDRRAAAISPMPGNASGGAATAQDGLRAASTSWSTSPAARARSGKRGVETTPEEFDDIVTLNMNGCFHTMRAVLPTMMAQRYGKIVNVGGTFGMRGRAGRMAYSASKWGLRGITKSFALEVGRLQHQRQLRRARHGRWPALPRQGLRRHGESASASR